MAKYRQLTVDNSVMMKTNKLTKILSGVVLLGIATAMAAPAQASSILSWEGDTSDFFSDVKPGPGNTFSVTFSLSTKNPSPNKSDRITTTGRFEYVETISNQFRYKLILDPNNPSTSDLTFSFPNGPSVTWATGTTFIGVFETNNRVKFEVEDPSLPTVTGISPADNAILVGKLSFYDNFNSDGKGKGLGNDLYEVSITTTTKIQATTEVPEPGTILGLLAVGGLGLVSSFKKQK